MWLLVTACSSVLAGTFCHLIPGKERRNWAGLYAGKVSQGNENAWSEFLMKKKKGIKGSNKPSCNSMPWDLKPISWRCQTVKFLLLLSSCWLMRAVSDTKKCVQEKNAILSPLFPAPISDCGLSRGGSWLLAGWPVTQQGTLGIGTLLLLFQITKNHNKVTFSPWSSGLEKPSWRPNGRLNPMGASRGLCWSRIYFILNPCCQITVLTQKNMGKTPISGLKKVK